MLFLLKIANYSLDLPLCVYVHSVGRSGFQKGLSRITNTDVKGPDLLFRIEFKIDNNDYLDDIIYFAVLDGHCLRFDSIKNKELNKTYFYQKHISI